MHQIKPFYLLMPKRYLIDLSGCIFFKSCKKLDVEKTDGFHIVNGLTCFFFNNFRMKTSFFCIEILGRFNCLSSYNLILMFLVLYITFQGSLETFHCSLQGIQFFHIIIRYAFYVLFYLPRIVSSQPYHPARRMTDEALIDLTLL